MEKTIRELFEKGIIDGFAKYFGEPGYTKENEEKDIILANWNNICPDIQNKLDEAGYTMLWYDEWHIDHENSKVWRNEPDNYWWRPSIAYSNGRVFTPDDDAMDWLEEFGNTGIIIPELAPIPEGFLRVAQIPNKPDSPDLMLQALSDVWDYVLCQYGSDGAIHFFVGNDD